MNKKFKVGLIRVLTTEDEEVLQSHGKQIMEYFPELEVVTKCIPDQYEGIHSPEPVSYTHLDVYKRQARDT